MNLRRTQWLLTGVGMVVLGAIEALCTVGWTDLKCDSDPSQGFHVCPDAVDRQSRLDRDADQPGR